MLWYKGWLETRFKLLFMMALVVFVLVTGYSRGIDAPADLTAFVRGVTGLAGLTAIVLAGAGINTQPAFQAIKGLHGSTLYTLSLPISRLQLLAVRASLGWLEMTGVIAVTSCGIWILFPALRATATPVELCAHVLALATCASGLYSITVLLATFLDDLWRVWGSMIAFGAWWWMSEKLPVPASLNIFRAMGQSSPLIGHTMPWTAMGLSIGVAAILFRVSLKIVRTREY